MSKKAARKVLAGPKPNEKQSPIAKWFAGCKDGEEFIDTWLEMRAAGETKWGLRAVIKHLGDAHDFPYTSQAALMQWLRKAKAEAYEAACSG